MIYTYECNECGWQQDEFRKLETRNQCPRCDNCKSETHKIIANYAAIPDVEPYFDDNLQSYIKSKQHRKEVMKEQGVAEKFGKRWY